MIFVTGSVNVTKFSATLMEVATCAIANAPKEFPAARV
jgi:hypothetical protein